ncbi:MAG: hypothetical protein J5809_06695 [Selenomonadaceae bacterium]|nr:hypothetical protein [Selenomonadaceae bacterium]
MRKIFLVCALILALGFSKAWAASLHEHPTVGLLPYTNKATVSITRIQGISDKPVNAPEIKLTDATLVNEFVIEKLYDTHRFRLVEREHLSDAAVEIASSRGGMIDSSTVLQAGKLLGAQFLVAGAITGLSTKPSGLDVSFLKSNADFNKMSVVASVTIRFIDVETGEIMLAASGTGESSRTNAEFKLTKITEDTYETSGSDASGYETPSLATELNSSEIKVAIGGQDYSLNQVRNALFKAVDDMVCNKNYGVLAKLDGKSKRKKV